MWYAQLQDDAMLICGHGWQWRPAVAHLVFTEYRDRRWLVWC